MLPESKTIRYECENGHVNDYHKTQPGPGHGQTPVCVECRARVQRVLVPVRECQDCGETWAYTGDSDRPTCPECKGKRTVPVSAE